MARPHRLALSEACWPGVEAAAKLVAEVAAGDAAVYGVNTGFGKLASVRIAADQIEELQRRLVLSHMCGIGPPLPDPIVRLTLVLKAASLARGHSGVRRATIDLLLALIEHDALPVIPAKGSVGASGDLAPLAHLAGCLIGEGEVRLRGSVVAGGRGAARDRRGAADARRQGRPRPDQRHPGVERAGARRAVRGARRARCRAGRRRDERRRGARQRCALRSAPDRRARPAGPGRGRTAPHGAARRQRDPRLASRGRRSGAGPLQPALPAAGDGAVPGAAGRGGGDPGARGERRLRQSPGVRRRRRC